MVPRSRPGLLAHRSAWGLALAVVALGPPGCSPQQPTDATPSSVATQPSGGSQSAGILRVADAPRYVGSDACQNCHTTIYDAWLSSQHSRSILTGDQARRAGMPLPRTAPGTDGRPAVESWRDIGFTVGGRKRLAYVDTARQVLPTSFRHRSGDWVPFPSTPMTCGPCHHTGYDDDPLQPRDPGAPEPWAELNVGCEACHGPAERHVETYDKDDIALSTSSRVCGECHTAVERILPKDELHATHDLVQTWNRDPHVTGVRLQSHNGFCARCHSPTEAGSLDPETAARTRVFSEDTQNVTCIACHDPHRSTNAAYTQPAARLGPPLPPRFQAYAATTRTSRRATSSTSTGAKRRARSVTEQRTASCSTMEEPPVTTVTACSDTTAGRRAGSCTMPIVRS